MLSKEGLGDAREKSKTALLNSNGRHGNQDEAEEDETPDKVGFLCNMCMHGYSIQKLLFQTAK